jgi:hypothetical protein
VLPEAKPHFDQQHAARMQARMRGLSPVGQVAAIEQPLPQEPLHVLMGREMTDVCKAAEILLRHLEAASATNDQS